MKPFFCTDITVDKNNKVINGTEFIKKSISEDKRAEMDARADELQRMINTARTPSWMVTLRSIAGFASLVMAMNLIKVVLEKGFSALFAADQITGTLIFLGAVAIWLYMDREGKARVRKMENDPAIKNKSNELEIEIAMMMHEMGVPASARSTDVLVFNYKVKDGEVQPVSPMMLPSVFMNFECKAYTEGDTVYLADSDSVYSFEKSDIKRLLRVDKSITVYSWNKQEEPTDPKYAAFGLSVNKMGMVTVPYYYVLEVEHNGETFGLYLPGYEGEMLRDLLGFDSAIDMDGDMVPLIEDIDEETEDNEVAEISSPEEEKAEAEAKEDADVAEGITEGDVSDAEAAEDVAEAAEDETEAAGESEAKETEDVAETDAAEEKENTDNSEDENSEEDETTEE